VTVKTVRYFRSVGMRDQPERTANGYKQCGVPHLVRVLQIKRLSELGVPLGRAVEVLHAEEQPSTALRVVDAET
jgi:DNA-binding transcriptional MerR regulator